MAFESILNEVEQLPDRQRASSDTDGATFVSVRAAKRKFRIVKREKNFAVLGVCEYCNAEFSADPATIGLPKDAHTHIQKQFIAQHCKRPDASKNPVRMLSKRHRVTLSTSGRP